MDKLLIRRIISEFGVIKLIVIIFWKIFLKKKYKMFIACLENNRSLKYAFKKAWFGFNNDFCVLCTHLKTSKIIEDRQLITNYYCFKGPCLKIRNPQNYECNKFLRR